MKENSHALAAALRELHTIVEAAPRRMSPHGAVLKCLLPVSAVATLELAADALEPPTRAIEGFFDQIVAAAMAGVRCPQNDLIPSAAFSRLAREGRIRVSVYARNWRVVEILEGPHAGKSTADDPMRRAGEKPYKVIDANAMQRRSDIPKDQRREPWKPGTPRP